MLDLTGLDIDEIAMALADQTDYDHRWLINPRSGRLVLWTSAPLPLARHGGAVPEAVLTRRFPLQINHIALAEGLVLVDLTFVAARHATGLDHRVMGPAPTRRLGAVQHAPAKVLMPL